MDRVIREAILHAATLAPSGDNAQPWRFRWDSSVLEVYLDDARAGSFFDVDHVASLISIGAVVANVELQAATLGWVTHIRWLPAGNTQNPKAHLSFSFEAPTPSNLAAAIPTRCVNRHPYRRGRPLPQTWLEERVVDAAGLETQLAWCTDSQALRRVARLVRWADWVRFSHPEVHGAFMAELRFSQAEAEQTRDGLAINTLESGPLAGPALRFLRPWRRMAALNRLGLYRLLARQADQLVRSASAVGLLSADQDTALTYLKGGVAMQRLWLAATAAGIAFQPVTVATLFVRRLLRHGPGAFEPPHTPWLNQIWEELQALFPITRESGLIMLFRVGYAKPPTGRSLRRPLDSFLLECEDSAALRYSVCRRTRA
jgi:nitroreductase